MILAEGAQVEELESEKKKKHKDALSEIEEKQQRIDAEIEKSRKKAEKTLKLCKTIATASSPKAAKTQHTGPLPKLRDFRGEGPKAIRDPYEFLNQCVSSLKAERVSQDRWIDAILPSLPSEGRI